MGMNIEQRRVSIREKLFGIFKKKEEKRAEKLNEQRFESIMVVKENLKYVELQFEKKVRFICQKCSTRLDNPIKTFSKEAHVLQHYEARHQ